MASSPTSSDSRTSCLIIGLQSTHPEFLRLFPVELERASNSSIDTTVCLIDPSQPGVISSEIESALQKQKFDVVSIGFGIRGNTAFTAIFEQIVNLAVREQAGAKFAFQQYPNDIVEAVNRVR